MLELNQLQTVCGTAPQTEGATGHEVAGEVGLEPTTTGLTARCSAAELLPRVGGAADRI